MFSKHKFEHKFKTVVLELFFSELKEIILKVHSNVCEEKAKKMRKKGQVVGKLHYFSSFSPSFLLSVHPDGQRQEKIG